MELTALDWSLVVAYFIFSFAIAGYYARRAGKDTHEFFLSGRNMPWWLAGTSLVATTFAADTPLAVTELVAQSGIAGNWLWWNAVAGLVLTVFFFARLWRRAGVLTDVEFVELRYDGKAAATLRGIKAIYFGLIINAVILGWVSLAMETVLTVLFPDLTFLGQSSFDLAGFTFSSHLMWVGVLVLVVAVYSLISGLWGVAMTDVFQFAIAMLGCFILAFYALGDPRVGGISGLMAKLPADTFRMLPRVGSGMGTLEGVGVLALTVPAFIAYIGVQWWASWYPGAEPGGGGYAAQRMMSAKDERHAMFAALWFAVAHICLRPWPWIIVALASLVMFPNLPDTQSREGFVLVMREVLPAGLIGLLFAAFLAAFMSTVATQLNWGVSYLVNDFWRRFIKKDGNEKYYVAVSRVMTFLLAVISMFITAKLNSIAGAWALILSASAGLGLVLILRWYWWRINAWSELVATIVPLVLALLVGLGVEIPGMMAPFPTNLFATVAYVTVAWVVATFITRPTAAATLDRFYRRVRPGGPGWAPVAARHPDVRPTDSLGNLAVDWLLGITLVYTVLFGVGYLIFDRPVLGLVLLVIGVACGAYLWRSLSRVTSLPEGADDEVIHPVNPTA
ncbi:MAG TPA: sodium:solute symporter family protein [Rhodothermales bacterium]|nr:sodium:solute symporter family protein [Rhodothermales bacterium]